MKTKISHGFPDHRWRFVCQFTSDLIVNYRERDVSGARVTVNYLEAVVGEIETFKPKRLHYGFWYRNWYGLLADGIYEQNMDLVQYSVAGMRMVVDQIFRKEATWERPQKGAA